MSKPSTMQRKVYDKLYDTQEKTGELPNLSDLARDIGITYMTLQQHLKALARKGYLMFESRGRGRSPTVRLLRLGIPVLGNISAGTLGERFEEPSGYLSLNGYSSNDSFGLQIEGNSMADLIQNGDIVILKRQQPVRSGQICAVRVQGETTLKYLDWEGARIGETVILRPHNPEYPSISIDSREVEIDGVYQGLLRGELISAFYKDVN